MKISGTNKEIVEIINLLDPSFKCKCNPFAYRFRCDSRHEQDCVFEETLPKEYGIYVRSYHIEYDGHKIDKIIFLERFYPDGNIHHGTVK
jgi:hypothetical protein